MKTFDILAAILVVVGAVNWGLVGLLQFDLVAAIFGDMSVISRMVYVLVGLAGAFPGDSVEGYSAALVR